jgi:DNA repair exonuclease SbcCD nuclease subunit
MNNVKILHTADIHIGATDAFLGANANSRRFETLITFEKIIDIAVENSVQLIAVAGDLFDNDNPETVFVDAVFKKITDCGIKVVYCAGNHDPLNANSPFVTRTLPQNLYVLGNTDQCFTFEDINVRVYGRSFDSVYLKGEEEFTLEVPNDDYINIMVQHGELKGDLGSDYNSITPKFVKKSGMDYIALGHIHKRTPVGKIDNTYFAYCGCPEGQGFDELDQKGVYMGTVSKGECNLEFIPVSKRKHIHQKIDITDATDISAHVLNTLSEKFENYSENLYKIELIGEIDPDFELNLSEITARLCEKLYFVKVKDSTEYKIDLELLAKDPSLKGIFVKNMLLKMEQAEDKEPYKKALKIGLKAFKSEVNYIED